MPTTVEQQQDQLRLAVIPARRGGWRVTDTTCVRGECGTRDEALALADSLARRTAEECDILVYDAYMRLRSVRRPEGGSTDARSRDGLTRRRG